MDSDDFPSEDELCRDAMEQALAGSIDDARWILAECSHSLRLGIPPHPILAAYLANCLDKITRDKAPESPAVALNLVADRPAHRPKKGSDKKSDEAVALTAAVLWAKSVLNYTQAKTFEEIEAKQGTVIRTLQRRLSGVDCSSMESLGDADLWRLAAPYHVTLQPLGADVPTKSK